MAASISYNVFLLLPHLSSSTQKSPQSSHSPCFNRCLSFSASKFNPSFTTASSFRRRYSGPVVVASRFARRACCIRDSEGGNSFTSSESESNSSEEGASFDLNLPKRSLLVHFTCNLCGERTKRLINRLAYERGTIFVQLSTLLSPRDLIFDHRMNEAAVMALRQISNFWKVL